MQFTSIDTTIWHLPARLTILGTPLIKLESSQNLPASSGGRRSRRRSLDRRSGRTQTGTHDRVRARSREHDLSRRDRHSDMELMPGMTPASTPARSSAMATVVSRAASGAAPRPTSPSYRQLAEPSSSSDPQRTRRTQPNRLIPATLSRFSRGFFVPIRSIECHARPCAHLAPDGVISNMGAAYTSYWRDVTPTRESLRHP